VDASDVCQSVLLSFLLRVAAHEYDLATSKQLTGLLMAMTRNKLAGQVRREWIVDVRCARCEALVFSRDGKRLVPPPSARHFAERGERVPLWVLQGPEELLSGFG
jgi:hypothetical protein